MGKILICTLYCSVLVDVIPYLIEKTLRKLKVL